MGILGRPQGLFNLHESGVSVGFWRNESGLASRWQVEAIEISRI